jgi:hypothetical protein
MATATNPQPGEYVHEYHADAYVLRANLEQPIEQQVEPQGWVEIREISDDSLYKFQDLQSFRVQGIISYQGGYSQVAGHKNLKASQGFTTLATGVVEGLNVLDVITADRVVGQISTTHPEFEDGQVPSVTFLGTRFENLRIGGHKIDIDPFLDVLGPKPVKDQSYFDSDDVLRRIGKQYESINNVVGVPEWVSEKYRWDPRQVAQKGHADCSVVSRVNGVAPGTSFGHVIDVPHFGRVFLGEVTLDRTPATSKDEHDTYKFNLTMIRIEMGCIGHGTAKVVALDTNGSGSKGKTGP